MLNSYNLKKMYVNSCNYKFKYSKNFFLKLFILYHLFLANFVGMKIEKPNTNNFKNLDPENMKEIRNYFTNNKKLKLIIVVISNSLDTIYSKYTFFSYFLILNKLI